MANYASGVTNYTSALNAVTFPYVPRDKITDQIFDTGPLFALMRGSGHLKELRGGLYIGEVINTLKSPNATSYSGGGGWKMQTFEGLIQMGWDWKLFHDGIVVTGDELVKNEGSDDAIIELVQARVDVASLTLPDIINRDLFRNNPAGTKNSDNTAPDPNSFEGLATLVDDGTLASRVGQQSRTTAPGGTFLKSKVNYTVAALSSLITAAQTQWVAAARGARSRTKVHFTTELIYGSYWSQLQTPERYVINPHSLEAIGLKTTGGNDLAFNDAVVLIDEKVPTTTPRPTDFTGSGGYWYGLNTDFFEMVVHPDRFFNIGEWFKDPYGDQYFMDIYFAGAFKCTRPNKQYVLWLSGG